MKIEEIYVGENHATQTSDYYAFYGKYVTKKDQAVPLSISRMIECEGIKNVTKLRIALGDIERAHKELDAIGASKHQKNTPQFSLSLAGRIRSIKK